MDGSRVVNKDRNSLPDHEMRPSRKMLLSADIAILMLTMAIAIILGNSLVIIAVWQNKGLRKQGRCHIISLAVADLLVGLIVVPIRSHQFISLDRFSPNFCEFYIWVDTLCVTASITSLTVISVDRCYKISYPFHYKVKVTTRRCIFIAGVVWLHSAIFATLGTVPYSNQTKIRPGSSGDCKNPKPVFYLVVFTVAYALPCVILVTSYTMIFIAAYCRRRKWSKQQENVRVGERRMFLKDLKNAKTLGIAVLVFIVCWGPIITTLALSKLYPQLRSICTNLVLCTLTTAFLPYGNSMCNPIIYALCDKEYRRPLKTVFKKIFRKWRTCLYFFLFLLFLLLFLEFISLYWKDKMLKLDKYWWCKYWCCFILCKVVGWSRLLA